MEIKKAFGVRLKYLRNIKGLSQEELAEKTGLHRTYISTIELGKRNVSLVNIEKIANSLECEIKELFEMGNIDGR